MRNSLPVSRASMTNLRINSRPRGIARKSMKKDTRFSISKLTDIRNKIQLLSNRLKD